MKQVPITDAIRQRLTKAAGEDVNIDNLAVYEATALNTKPIRKRHPVYQGARHTTQFLHEMANTVLAESLPLQIMHDGSELPIGRVFHGEVINGDELRVLFWVDKSHEDLVQKIDNSTIDQVSVSVLGKQATCSTCGFDFLGDEATFDNLWSGTDPKGHVMGQDGHHVRVHNLDAWFEMSLVGKGGATGARIADRNSSVFNDARLAANGAASVLTTLNLSSGDLETSSMDMQKLIDDLTGAKTKLALAEADVTSKDKLITELTAKVQELETKVAEFAKAPDHKAEAEKLNASLTEGLKKVLALKGDATTQVPAELDALLALAAAQFAELKLTVQPTNADPADKEEAARPLNLSAFKRRK